MGATAASRGDEKASVMRAPPASDPPSSNKTPSVADVEARRGCATPWPDTEVPECDLRDMLKNLLLLRHDGWDDREIPLSCPPPSPGLKGQDTI